MVNVYNWNESLELKLFLFFVDRVWKVFQIQYVVLKNELSYFKKYWI